VAPASVSSARFTAVLCVTAVVFFLTLLPFELIPEIPVDIDAKPFFVPLALCALLPSGRIGLAVALGVALGEGLRDLMEGYELDDPIGFFGYIAGFWTASAVFAAAPFNRSALVLGAVVCAAIQSSMEATSFLLFGAEAFRVAALSAVGNTISHGVVWGAIPLLLLVPALHGRFEAYLGFAPRGTPTPEPLPPPPDETAPPPPDAIASADSVWFRHAAAPEACLRGVTLHIGPGEVLALAGGHRIQRRTVAEVLAGLAPDATGGDCSGRVHAADSVAIIAAPARDHVTQPRPLQEVASAFMARGHDAEGAFAAARDALTDWQVPVESHNRFVWELAPEEQTRVLLAAAMARRPTLLVFDASLNAFGAQADSLLDTLLRVRAETMAVLLIDDDDRRVTTYADRVAVLADGAIAHIYDTPERARGALASDMPDDGGDGDNIERALKDPAPVRVPTLQRSRGGWWARRDPRVKWALFLVLILLIYVAPDWRWMAAMTALGGVIVVTARPSWLWLGFALLVQLPNVLGLVLLPALSGDGGMDSASFAFGLRLGLGWVAAIVFGISLLSSMDVPDMVSGLRGIALPRRFAFVVGYAFLLIYLSFADFARLLRALRPERRRGGIMNPWRFVRYVARLMVPAIITVSRRGGAMSLALAQRGGQQDALPVLPRRLDTADISLCVLGAATLFAATAARVGAL